MTHVVRSIRALFSSAAAYGLAVSANQGALILAGVFVAQLLGRDSFGRFSLLLVTMQVFASVGQYSLGLTSTKFVAEFRANAPHLVGGVFRFLFQLGAILALVAAILLVALTDTINERVFGGHAERMELFLLAPAAALQMIVTIQACAMAGFEAFGSQARISWIGAACTLLASAALGLGFGVAGAISGILCGLVFRLIASSIVLNSKIRDLNGASVSAVSSEVRHRLVSYAVPAALAGVTALPATWLAAAALTNQDGGLHAYAAYAAAFNIKSLMLFVPAIITNVTVPRLSFELATNDSGRVRHTFFLAVLAALVTLCAAALAVNLALPWVIGAFGSEFASDTALFRLVIITGVLEGVSIALYCLFQARGQLWLPFFVFSLPRDIVLVLAALLLCPQYGAIGLGAAALASSAYTILAVVIVLVLRRDHYLSSSAKESNA
jgi:O-antigen/teichoic acid export membrane protein